MRCVITCLLAAKFIAVLNVTHAPTGIMGSRKVFWDRNQNGTRDNMVSSVIQAPERTGALCKAIDAIAGYESPVSGRSIARLWIR